MTLAKQVANARDDFVLTFNVVPNILLLTASAKAQLGKELALSDNQEFANLRLCRWITVQDNELLGTFAFVKAASPFI